MAVTGRGAAARAGASGSNPIDSGNHAMLDPLARHYFMTGVMAAVADDGVSVVLSSHVLAELERRSCRRGDGMTALAAAAPHRPVPWGKLAWVTWRQHRAALAGVAVLLGALSLYLLVMGSRSAARTPASPRATRRTRRAAGADPGRGDHLAGPPPHGVRPRR
jgi:hypothetical protein